VCPCGECVRNCRHIPGYLIPADLDRIRQHLAPDGDLRAWALEHLLASPGALVLQRGQALRIPTLVPARRPDGACLFLTAESRCAIHAIAPFGCAFFDAHQPAGEADRRSSLGLRTVLEAWRRADLYALVWLELHRAGLQAPPPEACREQLRQARVEDELP
jgi:hypothetical protein